MIYNKIKNKNKNTTLSRKS